MLKKRFKIATIETKRHQQISKWMKQNAADTDHRYDIWHLEKCRVDFSPLILFIFQTALGKKIDKIA